MQVLSTRCCVSMTTVTKRDLLLSTTVKKAEFLSMLFYFSAPNFTWNVNSSRDLAIYIEPENATSIISNADLCSSHPKEESQTALLLIVVCSATGNFKARQAIRETWMSFKANDNDTSTIVVRSVFLLGQTINDTRQSDVVMESNTYGDIIQEGFIDAYLNL